MYIKGSGFLVTQITFHERVKYLVRGKKSIVIFYFPESYLD